MKKNIAVYSENGFLCEADVANTFLARFMGLMGQTPIKKALWIEPCADIHTFFMKETIDVVFADKDGEVLRVINSMPQNSVSGIVRKAHGVLELPSGTLERQGIKSLGRLFMKEVQHG